MILFEEYNDPIIHSLTDGDIEYYPNFLNSEEAFLFLNELKDRVEWEQPQIKVFGKNHLTPRLVAWFGKEDYGYSNYKHKAQQSLEALNQIQFRIEQQINAKFNGVLVNFYRNGSDRMGWHSDDEKELGENPVIASLNIGATRRFDFKHKVDKSKKFSIELENGSLLVMKGTIQYNWLHQLPAQKKIAGERINLTFRKIYSAE